MRASCTQKKKAAAFAHKALTPPELMTIGGGFCACIRYCSWIRHDSRQISPWEPQWLKIERQKEGLTHSYRRLTRTAGESCWVRPIWRPSLSIHTQTTSSYNISAQVVPLNQNQPRQLRMTLKNRHTFEEEFTINFSYFVQQLECTATRIFSFFLSWLISKNWQVSEITLFNWRRSNII